MWTKDALQDLVQRQLTDMPFVVVSNREPYIHTYTEKGIECVVPPSGLTVALDPVMQASRGTWIAHGSGAADRDVVDQNDRILVPPDRPCYALRRVWLSPEEEAGYYYGFANQALWPLCHVAYTRPVFDQAHWQMYKAVNERFADAVIAEIGDGPAFVFIQDYHLALLPRLLKRRNPWIVTGQFWHIPWPNREVFRICPWQDEILDGLLGNDLLGFHIQYHCNNFLDTVDRAIEARVDYEHFTVTYQGKQTAVRPFRISVDFEHIEQTASLAAVDVEMARLQRELRLDGKVVGLGLDRIDYTKGIPDRLRALERFLERYPEYCGRLVFIEAGAPSREQVEAYARLNEEVDCLVARINRRFGTDQWEPIIYLRGNLAPLTLNALRRLAHFSVVSSLHDGMNLVAKEYVASRSDEDGVLLLSQFTGAARELRDAVLINPYATDEFAEAIRVAIEMPAELRRQRMQRMRQVVKEYNIYTWGAAVINELAALRTLE